MHFVTVAKIKKPHPQGKAVFGTFTQKCPNCGQWVECEESGILEKAAEGMGAVTEIGEKIGGFAGKLLGKAGEKYGRKIGGFAANAAGGLIGGFGGVIFGDSYYFNCPSCGNKWSATDERDDQSSELKAEIEAEEKSKQTFLRSIKDNWDDCKTRDNYVSLSSKLNEYLNSKDLDNNERALLYDAIAATSFMSGKLEASIHYINKSLKLFPDDPTSLTYRGFYRYGLSESTQDALVAYDILKDLSHYYEERNGIQYFGDDKIKSTIENCIDKYTSNFHEIHPAQRQFVFFTDNYAAVTDNIKVLPLRSPIQNIYFPISHPKLNTLYVLHPLKKDTYLTVDNYEYELFNDQLLEFTRIMEHLGAKRISYNVIEDKSYSEGEEKSKDIEGEVNFKAVKVGSKVNLNDNSEKMKKLLQKFESEASFFDRGIIQMPDENSLVWYHFNKDWQQKVESRLSGRKHKESFIVSSYSEEFGSEGNKKEIEAEASYLMTSVKGKVNIEKNFHFKSSIMQQWKVEVEFYPLRESFWSKLLSFLGINKK